jgi:hypothetical protein
MTTIKTTRRSYTDILEERLIEQHGLEGYQELVKSGYFKRVTRRINLCLFNTPHPKCDKENMTTDPIRLELFEKRLKHQADRFPDQTAEQLLQRTIDYF